MAAPSPVIKTIIAGAAGGIEVAALVPDAPRAVAVIAHPHPLFGGSMDNKVTTTLARACFDAGAASYRFNFRGVGASAGTHDEGIGETADMLKVVAHAQAQHPDLPLWLAGFSFGGAVAVAAGLQLSVAEMILVAPSFQRLAHWPQVVPKAPSVAPVAGILIIHGEIDATVPLAESLAWARMQDVPVMVVPDADHFFHQRLHHVKAIASRWLAIRAAL